MATREPQNPVRWAIACSSDLYDQYVIEERGLGRILTIEDEGDGKMERAHLIACAPELRDALAAVLGTTGCVCVHPDTRDVFGETFTCDPCRVRNQARAVLARAKMEA